VRHCALRVLVVERATTTAADTKGMQSSCTELRYVPAASLTIKPVVRGIGIDHYIRGCLYYLLLPILHGSRYWPECQVKLNHPTCTYVDTRSRRLCTS
jgi:hypothetical protein